MTPTPTGRTCDRSSSVRRRLLAAVVALCAGGSLALTAAQAAGSESVATTDAPHVSSSAAADPDRPEEVPGENFRPARGETGVCRIPNGRVIQVNQDCPHTDEALSTVSGRGQSKNTPDIAADPRNPRHLVAAYNDYRGGDSSCGTSYSLDGGRTWTDVALPDDYVDGEFVGKPREEYTASAAASVGWDSRGNAYVLCMIYNRGVADISPNTDMSGGLYLFRSTGSLGSSWDFYPTPVAENKLLEGGPENFSILDSPRVMVDTHPRSPHRDRIYAFWMFQDSAMTTYIFSSYSDDYGQTFSEPVKIGASSDLCPLDYGLPTTGGTCNMSDNPVPAIAADGTVYVAWINRNGAQASEADNKNQVLVSTSRDGGVTFGGPVHAGDSYDLPDCDTYQGRGPSFGGIYNFSCVPEKGEDTQSVYRGVNYVRSAIDPASGDLVLVYGSYINRHSQGEDCQPQGLSPESFRPLYDHVKTAGCNNDLVISRSSDGGRTFTGTHRDVRTMPTVTGEGRQADTDQYFHDIGYTDRGTLVVSYLDRQHGDAAEAGGADVSLTLVNDRRSRTLRVTPRTMPVPSQHDLGRYAGDWNSLVVAGGRALPIWTDTTAKATAICPWSSDPDTPPELCHFDANGVTANLQNVMTARVPVGP